MAFGTAGFATPLERNAFIWCWAVIWPSWICDAARAKCIYGGLVCYLAQLDLRPRLHEMHFLGARGGYLVQLDLRRRSGEMHFLRGWGGAIWSSWVCDPARTNCMSLVLGVLVVRLELRPRSNEMLFATLLERIAFLGGWSGVGGGLLFGPCEFAASIERKRFLGAGVAIWHSWVCEPYRATCISWMLVVLFGQAGFATFSSEMYVV